MQEESFQGFLYHRVPENMSGTILYPLNELKITHPYIYTEHVKKYEGRSKLLTTRIPGLNCLWNDVLHLTAVTPEQLKHNLASAGLELSSAPWFKIPVSRVVGPNSVAFIHKDIKENPKLKEFELFNPKRMSIYKTVPKETILYYRQKHSEGMRPLLFHLIPHVLYKGSIETEDLEVVNI